MPNNLFGLWFVTLTITLSISNGAPACAATQNSSLRVTVIFNNVSHRQGLTPGWGFSCLVEGLDKTILFDTGADGGILLDNMRRLKLDPKGIDVVFLSHIHGDHTGGLNALLVKRSAVQVFMPEGFPASFRQAVAGRGAKVSLVRKGGRLMDHVHSTGELNDGIIEQAMIVETGKGLVVITGCAHPGIARIAETAIRLTGKKIHLLMGGFHLGGTSRPEIQAIIARLQSLDVEKVGPSHCTGETATALFRQAWGKDFVEAGLGAVIELPLR